MNAWLRVKLDEGMFSDEVAVTYPPTNNWQKSVFVPRECVRQEGGDRGVVKVVVVEKDGTRYAVLPSSRRDMVTIQEADIAQQ